MRLEGWQGGALAVARERRLDGVLARIAAVLAAEEGVALARVWLIGPGDGCDGCHVRARCGDRTRCLHLAASAGVPTDVRETWNGLGGAFRRVPLGVGKVGKVAMSAAGMLLHDMSERSAWIVRPEWAARERIRSFAAHPIVAGGDVTGVLAVFSRARIDAEAFARLRGFADHVAVAIGNARAFDDVDRRRAELEAENDRLRAHAAEPAGNGARPVPSLDLDPIPAAEWRHRARANVEAALARAGGRIYGRGGAAELLGLPPTTLASRVKALGIARRAGR